MRKNIDYFFANTEKYPCLLQGCRNPVFKQDKAENWGMYEHKNSILNIWGNKYNDGSIDLCYVKTHSFK